MFTTLQKLHTASTGGYTYPGFEVARLGTRENVKRFTEFFQNSHFAVTSNHLLVKLIESVPIEHGNDVRKYFDSVTDVAYEIASAVGVCSPAYRGGVTNKPWLYGTGNTEIPVAINDYNKEELEFTAENQYGITEFPPLRLLTHPITSVGLDIPDGRTPATEKGLVVYLIDIPLLCTQYRAFRLKQLETQPDAPEGPTHFVNRFVLPSLMADHLNIAFFNRLNALLQQRPVSDVVRRLPIGLPNYNEKLRQLCEEVLERFVGYKSNFGGYLANIPLALNNERLLDLVRLPNLFVTKQVSWALFIAQLPYVDFLFTLDDTSDGGGNGTYRNLLIRELKIALRDGVFKQRLPKTLVDELETTMQILAAQ